VFDFYADADTAGMDASDHQIVYPSIAH